MQVVLALPDEILFGENEVKCHGMVGISTPELECVTDTVKKTITITNAFEFQRGNPGSVRIILETLKNPTTNVVTGSF